MRTAAKRQVVAFKTFLRTVVHEVGHHLDGFYKRESSLANALLAQEAAVTAKPGAGPE
jgi:hypothetical protein